MIRTLVALLVLLGSAMVSAHSAMERANPGPRATVVADGKPLPLTLWFNERVEAKWSAVSVERADGTALEGLDQPKGVAGDPKALRVTLPPLAPGRYTVRYRVLSVDGHIVNWGYEFTVVNHAGNP